MFWFRAYFKGTKRETLFAVHIKYLIETIHFEL